MISNCLLSVVSSDTRNSALCGLVLRRALLCYSRTVLQDGNPIVIATHRFKGREALCGCFGVNLSIKYFHFLLLRYYQSSNFMHRIEFSKVLIEE